MFKSIVLRPRIMSEKAYGLSQTNRTYVFDVPAGVNKHNVAHAVTAQFDVVVESVNLTNIPGKAKRTVRKGGRQTKGRDNDVRKAYVKLAEGHSLPLFAAVEEAEAKQEATQEKLDKAMAKQSEKDAKRAKKETKQ